MIQNMQLAQSHWPRSGCDRANRSHAAIPGAEHGRTLLEVQLPHAEEEKNSRRRSGCVITDTMTLRVVYDGILSAVTMDGEILWSVELRRADNEPCTYWSLPVALQKGACLVALPDSICVYNRQGDCLFQRVLDGPLDDSGPSPNLTDTGHLIIACITGEVLCVDTTAVKQLGCFGYDILPPALYSDNSLAIAGYYGTGFCRIRLDGQKVWTTEFAEADLLPTINQQNIAAVGSLNDEKSAFFSFEGKLLGTYARPSIFAEYSPQAWIARSHQYLAKLTVSGQECWGYALHDDSNWGHCQPIVDSQGRIYVLDDAKLLCFTGEGEMVFATDIQDSSQGGLSCILPGKLAYTNTTKNFVPLSEFYQKIVAG